MSLRAVFSYQNLDSTADLNLRFEKLVSKGVFFGGNIVADGTTNSIVINPFRASSFDGMVVVETDNTSIVVTGNQKSYICLHAKYNSPAAPTLAWVVHTQTTYNADPNKDHLILFGTVDLSASSGPVFSNLVSYAERDAVTVVGRDSYLGAFANLTALEASYPATAPTQQKHNDIALAAVGIAGVPTWYRWDSTSEAFVAFGAYANEIAALNAHLSNSNIHVTAQQKDALVGSYGSPSSANKYVTENDPVHVLSTAERDAISGAVGIGAGLSDTNPLVADGLGVVSHILIQKVADGSNVVALTAESFGDFPAVIYVGRQGIDVTGRSSACQYFSVEDLFGDGLAPTIGGVESPVTITNVNWNATSGATLNPSSNSQVDASGFLTINPGQTLYLNLNINVPLSTQFNVRLNAKGRVRDLAPNWNNPVSFPARAASTAFRKGREPYVLANTGDFKSFRVGDGTKANVFIDADQTGYPSYGIVRLGFYAGASIPGNLKGLIRASVGSSAALDVLVDNLYLRFGATPDWTSVYLRAHAGSNTVFAARVIVGVPVENTNVSSRVQKYILDNDKGIIRATSREDTWNSFGSAPAFVFMGNESVGLGLIPEYSVNDPGGSITYSNAGHIRYNSATLSDTRRFDVLFLTNPASDFDSDALSSNSALAFHKSTTGADSTGTYTVWARSNYGSTIHNVIAIATNSGRSPNPSAYFAEENTYTLSGIRSSVTAAIKFTEKFLASNTVAVGGDLHAKGVVHTYSGLNSTTSPAIGFNVYGGAAYVFGAAATLTNTLPLRLGSDTTYGLAFYARDNAGVLRNGLSVGVSDAILLSYATTGSVRFGTFGYQMFWNKETPSSDICPHIVIEESNTAVRELLIGRRAAGGGAFAYSSAIRIKEGVLTLPYIADGSAMLRFGNADTINIGIGAAALMLSNGTYAIAVSANSLVLGNNTATSQSAVYFHTYGQQVIGEDYWMVQVGSHVNDVLMLSGVAGARAFIPGVTDVLDFGSTTNRIRAVYCNTVNASASVIAPEYFVSLRMLPILDTVDIGSTTNPFRYLYTHNLATDNVVMESVLSGSIIDTIRPKVTNTVSLGTSTYVFDAVWAGSHHGVAFYALDGSSVIGRSGVPFMSAYLTNVTSNTISVDGTNARVGSVSAPFDFGWFKSMNYNYMSSRTYYRSVTEEPEDPVADALDIDLTSIDNAYDHIVLDFEFTTTASLQAFAADRIPTSGTKCWLELPNAADYCTNYGNGVYTGRIITITIRTAIKDTANSTKQTLGIGVDKYQDTNNLEVVLNATNENGWHIHTLKLKALPFVDRAIPPYGLLSHAGWNCLEYTVEARHAIRPYNG